MQGLRVLVLILEFAMSVSLSSPYLVAKEKQESIADGYRAHFAASIAKREILLRTAWKPFEHTNQNHPNKGNFIRGRMPGTQ
jgi:hypothetical protein